MPGRLLIAPALVLALAACSRDAEPAAAAPPSSAPPWADAVDAPVTPEPAAAAEVPERFRGEWNMDPAACGTGLNDSRLDISAREIRWYESGGEITKVEQPAPDEIALTAALAGEGEEWTDTARFRLSPDGRTLTTVGEGAPLVRRRCP